MIRLFPPNQTTFTTVGLVVLNKYLKKCEVKEILNGNFSADITIEYYPRIWAKIEKEMIIVIPTHRGPKAFRIVNKKIDTRYMYIYAQHIWWDLGKTIVEDINIVGKNGKDAGDYIIKRAVDKLPWTFTSDITSVKNCRLVREYVIDAFMGTDDNTFKNRWGGELECNDFTFSINSFRGSKVPKVIKYGKNVEAFEFYEDMSTVGTKLMPLGYDGLLLPELYVESPLIDSYNSPIIKKVDASGIKLAGTSTDPSGNQVQEDGYASLDECYQAMRDLCEDLFDQGIDKPTQNVRVSIAELSKFDQYKEYGYEVLETIGIGDVVDVEMIQYNITVRHRCISITYDALKKKYIETELGEFKVSSGSIGNDFVADTSFDEALEGYYEGVYYHRNMRPFSIDGQMKEAAFLSYGTARNTHLSLFVSLVFKSATPGLLTCNIKVNNDVHEFVPKQTFNAGWTTFTIAIPILFVEGGKSQSLSIWFNSTTSLRVGVQNFQVTLRGQGVAKGGIEEKPHAEIDETYNFKAKVFKKSLKTNENVTITLQKPKIYSTEDNLDITMKEFNEELHTMQYQLINFPLPIEPKNIQGGTLNERGNEME